MIQQVERYIAARELSASYADTLRRHVRAFCHWVGREIPVTEVTSDLVNAWLADLRADSRLGPKSRHDYRASVLAVWRDAWETGLADHRPERVRTVRVPHTVPIAWTLDEVRRLVKACQTLQGIVEGTQIARSAWFDRFVRLGWYTGLRLSDLLAARGPDVAPNGVLRLATTKTGRIVCARLPASLASGLPKTGPLLPWPGGRRTLYRWLEKLVKAAGIRRGSSRWLRRSAASYVERDHPGAGHRLLGHSSEGMARRHYLDPAITGRLPPMPPHL